MTGGGKRRRSGMARLLVLCAVLLGVMLMHGSPATAASGCHEGASSPAAASTGHDAGMTMGGAEAHGVNAAPATHDMATARVGGREGMSGASCLATDVRGGLHLPAPGLLAVGVDLPALVLLSRFGRQISGGLRGPPAGRDLLLQVCVART